MFWTDLAFAHYPFDFNSLLSMVRFTLITLVHSKKLEGIIIFCDGIRLARGTTPTWTRAPGATAPLHVRHNTSRSILESQHRLLHRALSL